MSRCIYADVLKEDIAKQLEACKFIFGDSISELLEDSMDGVYRTIDRQPTADVIEIKHGKNISDSGFLCNVCSFGDFGGFHGYEPNYCPNCGAKMDEGREDEHGDIN